MAPRRVLRCFLIEETIFSWNKIEMLVSEYSELSKTSRNVIFSRRPGVCGCALDFQLLKPLYFLSGLRYRVEVVLTGKISTTYYAISTTKYAISTTH